MNREDLVPEGYYDAVAVPIIDDDGQEVLVQWGTAGTGTQQLLLHFSLLDEGEWKGTVLPWWGFFTKDAYQRTLQSLRFCGWVGNSAADLGPLDQKVSILIEHKESQQKPGHWYAQVAFVNRFGGGVKMKNRMTQREVEQMAARLRSAASAIPPVPGLRVPRGSKATPAPSQDAPPSNGNGEWPAAAGSKAQPRNDDWGERSDGPRDPRGAPQPPPRGDDDIPF